MWDGTKLAVTASKLAFRKGSVMASAATTRPSGTRARAARIIPIDRSQPARFEPEAREARARRTIPSPFLRRTRGFRLAVDDGHVPRVVAFAGSRGEVVESLDLRGAQLDAVGGGVLLDAGDSLGARNRGDVVALREEPG